MNIKRKQEVVIKAPLLDGDNIPNIATTMGKMDKGNCHRNYYGSKQIVINYYVQIIHK